MTPQLQQAIKLLQFSSLELVEYVETQLELNPLLDRDEFAEASGEVERQGFWRRGHASAGGQRAAVRGRGGGSDGARLTEDDLDVEFYDNLSIPTRRCDS